MIDYNHSINSGNIRRQVVGYIMSLKRKRRIKLKAYSPGDNEYYLMFNNVLLSDSDLLRTNTHKGCCMLNATEYNYKLRSVIGREDESKVTKWTWFNKRSGRHTSMFMDDITKIGRSHQHWKSYWPYT